MLPPRLLLIGNGYVGSKIADAAKSRGWNVRLARVETRKDAEQAISLGCDFVINAAGFIGKPNVEACEDNKAVCYAKNAVLPFLIASACHEFAVPFLHISTGCIYDGYAQVYTEEDSPNFEGSFYSHTKAEAERLLKPFPDTWIFRLRMPFDGENNPRNYLVKLAQYQKLIDATNSATYLPDFVEACLDAFALQIPYGTYNIVNGPAFSARDLFGESKEYFSSLAEFNRFVRVPRSNCILSNEKAIAAGLRLTNAQKATAESFKTLPFLCHLLPPIKPNWI